MFIWLYIPRKRLFSTPHWIKYVIRKSVFCISKWIPFLCVRPDARYVRVKKLYIYTFYTFTVSGALLRGNGFRWKLTHKWIHCRRKFDSKLNSLVPSVQTLFFFIRPHNTSNTTRQSKHRSLDVSFESNWLFVPTSLRTF